jgi:hypothetical protein
MPLSYTPASVKLTTISRPQDGELRSAASVNGMTTVLADGVKYAYDQIDSALLQTKYAGVANMMSREAIGGTALVNWAVYSKRGRRWLALSHGANSRFSADHGLTWQDETALATYDGGLEAGFNSADADEQGNVIAPLNGGSARYAYFYDSGTGMWSTSDIRGGVTSEVASILFMPTSDLWVAAYGDSVVKVSDTGLTGDWAPVAPGFTTLDLACSIGGDKATGRMVCAAIEDGEANLLVSTSADGGATWTLRAPVSLAGFAVGVLATTRIVVLYNPTSTTWIIAVGKEFGGNATRVFRSTDQGVTWTAVGTYTAGKVLPSAVHNGAFVLALLYSDGRMILAVSDTGAAWSFAGFETSGAIAACGIFSGANRLMVFEQTYVYRGLALGNPALDALA